MELLFSNFPPMRTSCDTFSDTFYRLIPQSTKLDIAVGYITSDSLIELKQMMEIYDLQTLNLSIGMHYIERFTRLEYNAALTLNDFLQENNRGEVRLVTPFRYHGKLYSYSNENGPFAGIIGSNNLSSIIDGANRTYESSVLIDEPEMAIQMNQFINRLVRTSTENINCLNIENFNEVNPLLDGHENVRKVNENEIANVLASCTDVAFEIPIKPYEVSPQSNLNVFFGRGRVSKNGIIKPRHWYEVELIVSKQITSQLGYPEARTESAEFTVITDDGWSFDCKVSGDYSKNFRSQGDLKILGKWIKGRLENAGVLTVGDPVKQETLEHYGRSTFTLTKTTIPNVWYLDFGVR